MHYIEMNWSGAPNARQTVSAARRELADVLLTPDRLTAIAQFDIGADVSNLDDPSTDQSSTDVIEFVHWTLE